jgi:hypothetical protein
LTQHATLKVFFLALAAYAVSAQVWAHPISLAPHYVYLAYALLHHHVDLIQLPPVTYDLLHVSGQWFVAGSPMPSILMLPFVVIFGAGFSDVAFSVVLGAIDVALVYTLLGSFIPHPTQRASDATHWTGREQSLSGAESKDAPRSSTPLHSAQSAHLHSVVISESACRWITLLFALGTPFWYLAALGTYWFTAQLVAVFFTLLAVREALTKQRRFLVGLELAGAGFARPTALFLAPFFLIILFHSSLITRHSSRVAYSVVRNVILFSAALAIGIGAHFAYNYIRFKSFTDFGYAYVAGAHNITDVYERYGGFNPRFVPCNLAVSLLSPPEVNGAVPTFITQACAYLLEGVNLSDASAPIAPDPLGMSIFFVTPALLIIFAPLGMRLKRRPIPARSSYDSAQEGRRPGWKSLILAAWVGLLTTLIPLWFYHNTGSLQFGWRYLFDAAPLWIILLAAGMQKMTRLKQGLILVSIAINLWGLLWMFEKLNGARW